MDPRTGFGQMVGEISEIMVFDRELNLVEKEMVEDTLLINGVSLMILLKVGSRLRMDW